MKNSTQITSIKRTLVWNEKLSAAAAKGDKAITTFNKHLVDYEITTVMMMMIIN